MHAQHPVGGRLRRGISRRDAAVGLACIAIIIVGFAAIFKACGGGGEPDWDHPVFWVLHREGTLRKAEFDDPPGDVPEGDEWVRPVIYRCLDDGTEFVAYHTRKGLEPDEGMRVMQVARPGGPWYGEDNPETYEIMEGVACPQCGAGRGRLEKVTPETARTILSGD